jgi:hypothetical protein
MGPLVLLLSGLVACIGSEILTGQQDQRDLTVSFEIRSNFSFPVIVEYDDGGMGSFMVSTLRLTHSADSVSL